MKIVEARGVVWWLKWESLEPWDLPGCLLPPGMETWGFDICVLKNYFNCRYICQLVVGQLLEMEEVASDIVGRKRVRLVFSIA